jgi:putative protease
MNNPHGQAESSELELSAMTSEDAAVRPMELLAPAGDWPALHAALDAGADAVYFGLTLLNARRRARNFDQTELGQVVQTIHDRGARAYLTLNIDLRERDLPQAARVLQLADEAGVDAVLVRDAALVAFCTEFPGLELHFSTQTCMANSADVTAAEKLGATRVVLARELSIQEIEAVCQRTRVQTEVFGQGALCFCISGRCLMSSWVGGRSGNRGLCTSPCRVPWSLPAQPSSTPLSMHDLTAIDRLEPLRQAGVAALKIEGRMKTADWVSRAVALYRRALDGQDIDRQSPEVVELGAYTGRAMTSGYLDEDLDDLTGAAGRERRAAAATSDHQDTDGDMGAEPGTRDDLTTFELEIQTQSKQLEFTCRYAGETDTWSVPKTVVRRKHKAITIGQLLNWLAQQSLQGCRLDQCATDDLDFLMVPRRVNELVAHINKFLQHRQKVHKRLERTAIPAAAAAVLDSYTRCPANQTPLGQPPDRVRLHAEAVESFLERVQPDAVIVEGLTVERLKSLRSACGRTTPIVALPPVFFEDAIPEVKKLLRQCARTGVTVEVNSWGGWYLAKQAGVRMEGGPHLGVLNSLAARVLGSHGLQSVTLSIEADRLQLQHATDACPVPCSLVVFGRPALMITRVPLPEAFAGETLVDRREVRVVCSEENGLWVLRPVDPFDLRDQSNDRIRVKHLVVDLVGSPDPVREWLGPRSRRPDNFRFNYDRRLA